MLISRDLRRITKCRISGPRNVSDDPGRLYHKEIKIEQYQYRDHIYVLDIYIHVCIRVEEKQSMIHDLIRICVCVCIPVQVLPEVRIAGTRNIWIYHDL